MKQLLSVACVLLGIVAAVPAEEAAVLAKQLKNPNPEQRRAAAKGLFDMGAEALPAVPDLMQSLRTDHDLYVRRFSAQALGEIGPDAKQAIPALKSSLSDSKPEMVEAAATALSKLGPNGITALTDVVKNKAQDVDVRKAAITALGTAGANAADAVPVLIDVLKGGQGDKAGKNKKGNMAGTNLQVEAALALGDIGPDAKDAVATLEEYAGMKGKSPLKTASQDALKKITGKGKGKKKKVS